MTIFINGGCKNGKSTFALNMAKRLAGNAPRYYVATMQPCDEKEWECVRTHRAARAGMGFETLEQGVNLPGCLDGAMLHGTFLVDSITALLANEMFRADGRMDRNAAERVAKDLTCFLASVKHAVFVSDYLDSDGRAYDPWSEHYRLGLARLDRLLARSCDCVAEICAGLPIVHKGRLPGVQ